MKSNWLFQLIKTLSKAEKRHFKLYLGPYDKKGESFYMRLFNRFSKAEKYDEKALMASFPSQQRAVLKNQLFHKVLGSLIKQHEGNTAYGEVQLLIQKSDVLYQRKLFKAADQLLKKAAQKAEELELFETLMTIYQRWKRLYIFVLGVEERAFHIQRFWELEQKVLSQLANLREMEWASMQVFDWYYRHHYAKTAEEKKHYDQLMQHPLLQHIDQSLSFSAKVIFLNTLGLYNDCIGEKKACIDFRKQLVQLYQEYPHWIKERATQYLAASNNWILGLIHLEAYSQANEALEQIHTFPTRLQRPFKGEEEVMWFRLYHSLSLEVSIRTGNFRKAQANIPEIEKAFVRLGNKLNEAFKLPFYYFFAYTQFALCQYKEALDWLAPLVHKDDPSFRSELFRFGRLLYLVIHYELGNFELLPSITRSTQRYLKKSGKISPYEKILLDFFNKTPYTDSKTAFQTLLAGLDPLFERPTPTGVLHHFHFLSWCKGHIEGQNFEFAFHTYLSR
ncbi:MAG: hypothetical protein R2828_17555 [Saprospiraceae bacterium]